MTVAALFSTLAGVLSVTGSLWYILAILRKDTRPKWLTWLIWGMLDVIILAGMWRSGHVTNWQIIVCTVNAWTVFALGLKYGITEWSWIDTVCLIGAAAGCMLLWHLPAWALAISLIATCFGAIPTYRSAWTEPRRENLAAWTLGTIPSVLLLCVVPWTFAAAAQTATFGVVDGLVSCIILVRRRS